MKSLTLAASTTLALLCAAPVLACPDYTLAPAESYDLTGDELYAAYEFAVIAGGDVSIDNCGINTQTDRGPGYVVASPDFSFFLSGMAPYQLVLSTQATCDAVLLVNSGSASWYYDDDDAGGSQAQIVLTRPIDGRIDVWVGTYDGQYCDATLRLETFDR